jgi:hypothetical protein
MEFYFGLSIHISETSVRKPLKPHLWVQYFLLYNLSGTHPVTLFSRTAILSWGSLLSYCSRWPLQSNISRQSLTTSQSEDPPFPREPFDASTVAFERSNASLTSLKQGNTMQRFITISRLVNKRYRELWRTVIPWGGWVEKSNKRRMR